MLIALPAKWLQHNQRLKLLAQLPDHPAATEALLQSLSVCFRLAILYENPAKAI